MSGCTCSFPRSTNFLRWVLQLSGHVMMQKEKWLILLQENIALVSACSDYLVLIHSACNNIFFCVVMMSPEVATSPPWRSLFENDKFKRNLVLKAVDEAHCICEWLVTQSFYHSLLWVRFIVHRGPSLRKSFPKSWYFLVIDQGSIHGPFSQCSPSIWKNYILITGSFWSCVCEIAIESVGTKSSIGVSLAFGKIYISFWHLHQNYIICLQKDLSGVARALKECTNSSRMPKTIIFCRTRHAVSKV